MIYTSSLDGREWYVFDICLSLRKMGDRWSLIVFPDISYAEFSTQVENKNNMISIKEQIKYLANQIFSRVSTNQQGSQTVLEQNLHLKPSSYFFSFSNYKNTIEFNSQIADFSCFPVLRNLFLRLINSNLITENANVITKKKKVRRKEIWRKCH